MFKEPIKKKTAKAKVQAVYREGHRGGAVTGPKKKGYSSRSLSPLFLIKKRKYLDAPFKVLIHFLEIKKILFVSKIFTAKPLKLGFFC